MSAFLLTWKHEWWPPERLIKMINEYKAAGHVDQMWRVSAHKQACEGDRAYLLKQGKGARGIFGIGTLLEAPVFREDPDGLAKPWWRSVVRFNVLSNPLQGSFLFSASELEVVLGKKRLEANSSGQGKLPDEAEQWLRFKSNEISPSFFSSDSKSANFAGGPTTGPRPTAWSGMVTRDTSTPSATYAMRFGNTSIWKIGHASDLPSRVEDINRHIPFEDIGQKWVLAFKQLWPNFEAAYNMEQTVLNALSEKRTEGERVRCSKEEIEQIWTSAFIELRLRARY